MCRPLLLAAEGSKALAPPRVDLPSLGRAGSQAACCQDLRWAAPPSTTPTPPLPAPAGVCAASARTRGGAQADHALQAGRGARRRLPGRWQAGTASGAVYAGSQPVLTSPCCAAPGASAKDRSFSLHGCLQLGAAQLSAARTAPPLLDMTSPSHPFLYSCALQCPWTPAAATSLMCSMPMSRCAPLAG